MIPSGGIAWSFSSLVWIPGIPLNERIVTFWGTPRIPKSWMTKTRSLKAAGRTKATMGQFHK